MGEVLDLAKLAPYSDGSVVSKSLINRPTGSATMFSFDKGEGLSEHSAPFDALILVVDGEAEITLAGKPHRLKSGQMLVMPSGIPHAGQAVGRFKMLLFLAKTKGKAEEKAA